MVLGLITRARPTMLIADDNGIHYFKTNEPSADHRPSIAGGLMTGANHRTNGLRMRERASKICHPRSCIAFLFLHSSFSLVGQQMHLPSTQCETGRCFKTWKSRCDLVIRYWRLVNSEVESCVLCTLNTHIFTLGRFH